MSFYNISFVSIIREACYPQDNYIVQSVDLFFLMQLWHARRRVRINEEGEASGQDSVELESLHSSKEPELAAVDNETNLNELSTARKRVLPMSELLDEENSCTNSD